MKEYPILFQPDMVRAILDGRKSQTRRILKASHGQQATWLSPELLNKSSVTCLCLSHEADGYGDFGVQLAHPLGGPLGFIKCPFGNPGDMLWVLEMLYQNGEMGLEYVACKEQIDNDIVPADYKPYRNYAFCNIPSIHMPKWAARIYLQVTDIRVERMQDISEEDAIAEGVMPNCTAPEHCPSPKCHKDGCQSAGEYIHYLRDYDDFPAHSARESFQSLITKIHGAEVWQQNPWVWVVSFRVLSTTGRPENLEELCAAL